VNREAAEITEESSNRNDAGKQQPWTHRTKPGHGRASLWGMARRKPMVREGSGLEGYHNGVLHGHGRAIAAVIHGGARC